MNIIELARRGLLVPYYKQHALSSLPKPWSKTKKKPRESRSEKRKRLERLENEPVPQLFQNNPALLAIGIPASGWTRTTEGFCKSARNRKKAVLRNNRMTRRRFTRLCNINLFEPRHPALLNRDFKALVEHLEARGLIGHWTIQINRANVVHWHILFVDCHLKPKKLKRLVKECLHKVNTFPRNRVYTDFVRNQSHKLDYILQVKKTGYGKVTEEDGEQGKVSWATRQDIYKDDRILFVSKTGLHKNGTIGRFWAEGYNEKKIWSLICSETATVEKNYQHPRVKEYVHWVNERFGIPMSWARWSISLNPGHLLDEETVAPGLPPRNSRRIRKSRSSSGLVGEVFRSGRHGTRAWKYRPVAQQLPVQFKAREIGRIGLPRNGLIRMLQKHFSTRSVGLLRDSKKVDGIGRFLKARLTNEEIKYPQRTTFESGP